MDVIVLGGVVQHRVEHQFVDLRDGANITRHCLVDLDVILALKQKQMADLEWLPTVADVELAVACHRALVDPEHAELADIGIDADLEHVREHMLRRVGHGVDRLRCVALSLQELRWIGFGRIRHQLDDHVEQFADARAVACRHKTDRHQMAFAHRLLERLVQLCRIDVALFEIGFHPLRIDFDDLIDQRAMRLVDARKI